MQTYLLLYVYIRTQIMYQKSYFQARWASKLAVSTPLCIFTYKGEIHFQTKRLACGLSTCLLVSYLIGLVIAGETFQPWPKILVRDAVKRIPRPCEAAKHIEITYYIYLQYIYIII